GPAHGGRGSSWTFAVRRRREVSIDPFGDGWRDLDRAGRPELVWVTENRLDPDRPGPDGDGHPHVGRRIADVGRALGSMPVAGQPESPAQRLGIGLVDRQVVAEHPDGEEDGEAGPLELRLDDGPV